VVSHKSVSRSSSGAEEDMFVVESVVQYQVEGGNSCRSKPVPNQIGAKLNSSTPPLDVNVAN
jgi:hypothetical protein